LISFVEGVKQKADYFCRKSEGLTQLR